MCFGYGRREWSAERAVSFGFFVCLCGLARVMDWMMSRTVVGNDRFGRFYGFYVRGMEEGCHRMKCGAPNDVILLCNFRHAQETSTTSSTKETTKSSGWSNTR